jgi:hypothetical protein
MDTPFANTAGRLIEPSFGAIVEANTTLEARILLPIHQDRETGSKKCGCQMRVECCRDAKSNTWSLAILEASHNHGRSADPTITVARVLECSDQDINSV